MSSFRRFAAKHDLEGQFYAKEAVWPFKKKDNPFPSGRKLDQGIDAGIRSWIESQKRMRDPNPQIAADEMIRAKEEFDHGAVGNERNFIHLLMQSHNLSQDEARAIVDRAYRNNGLEPQSDRDYYRQQRDDHEELHGEGSFLRAMRTFYPNLDLSEIEQALADDDEE